MHRTIHQSLIRRKSLLGRSIVFAALSIGAVVQARIVDAAEPMKPAAQRAAAKTSPSPGKFGRAVDIANMPLRTRSLAAYGQFPLTVELWCKLPGEKMQRFHLLAANAPGGGAAHWELYSTPLQGHLTATLTAVEPKQIESFVRVTDDAWHHVALTCDGRSAALFLDGKEVARQSVKPAAPVKTASPAKTDAKQPAAEDLEFFVGSDVPQNQERLLPALVDNLRISRVVRTITSTPEKSLTVDEQTVGLWSFDEEQGNRRRDGSKNDNALAYSPGISSAWTPRSSNRPDAEAWEKATDDDWLDGRVNQMDRGPFWGCSMRVPASLGNKEGPYAARGLVLRLGDKGEASVLFDRARMQLCAAWLGGIEISNRRFGLIEHPMPVGKLIFSTPSRDGWTLPDDGRHGDPKHSRWGPPQPYVANFDGAYIHNKKTILHYRIGSVPILEMPGIIDRDGLRVITRTVEARRRFVHESFDLNLFSSTPAVRERVGEVDMIVCRDGSEVLAVALVSADSLVARDKVRLALDGSESSVKVVPGDQSTLFQVMYWRGAAEDLKKFAHLVANTKAAEPLTPLVDKKVPSAVTTALTTVGKIAQPKPGDTFAVDTLTLPFDNPSKSIFYVTGLGFLDKNRIAISTIYGDVWIVSGIDDKLGRLTWKRFASGMYQPLGLVVRHETVYVQLDPLVKRVTGPMIYVLERGQITRLVDIDDDGQADLYQNYYNRWVETGAGHAYDTALKLGPDGSMYFFKGQASEPDCRESGCLVRVFPGGAKHEIFASGFRHPIGLGIDPVLGTLTGGDQQGNWMPATRIDQYRLGGFYGDMRTHHRKTPPTDYDKPICWLPQYVDNSAGGQVWVPRGAWGPLAGSLLHFSWGRCTLHQVLREAVDGHLQGGVVRLPVEKFLSGPITGAFNPHDGHLYVVGLHGWQTAGAKDGCLQRVRYTGAKLRVPLELTARKDGLLLRVSEPLDPAAATDVKNYAIEQWNYRYSEQYGSDHWSVADPRRMGHDAVPVVSAALSADGRVLHLRIPTIKPVMQMKLTYKLKARDGAPVEDTIHHTIHRLGEAP